MKRTKPLKSGGFKRAPARTERGRRILAGTEPKISIDFAFDLAAGTVETEFPCKAPRLVPTVAGRARMASMLQAEAPRPVPKPETFRSEAWLRAVRSIPCVHCGGPVQAAHRNEGKGTGQKTDDCLTAALCPPEHARIDQGKDLDREARRALIDRYIVLTLRELALRGLVGVVCG